jgi:predicted dinucleotide-binding enzyme
LWANHGHEIVYGVRNPESDKTLSALDATTGATATDSASAVVGADVVVFATSAAAAVSVAGELGEAGGLAGVTVIDATNQIGSDATVSVTEQLAAALPGSHVVKAFNNQGFNIYGHPDFDGTAATMFIAGNSDEAKTTVTELAEVLGFHVIDAGGLQYAYHLEKLAELWVNPHDVAGARARQRVPLDDTLDSEPRGTLWSDRRKSNARRHACGRRSTSPTVTWR